MKVKLKCAVGDIPAGTVLVVEPAGEYECKVTFPDGKVGKAPIRALWEACGKRVPKPGNWCLDSVVKSVDGADVEPDGYSPAGWPAWTLVLGLV